MSERRCATCGAFLMCDQCLRPIKVGARAAVVHRDGQCHAVHAPDCFTASWTLEGFAARLLTFLAVLLGLGWLVETNPGAVGSVLQLLPH